MLIQQLLQKDQKKISEKKVTNRIMDTKTGILNQSFVTNSIDNFGLIIKSHSKRFTEMLKIKGLKLRSERRERSPVVKLLTETILAI